MYLPISKSLSIARKYSFHTTEALKTAKPKRTSVLKDKNNISLVDLLELLDMIFCCKNRSAVKIGFEDPRSSKWLDRC